MNKIQKTVYPFARLYLLQLLTNHLGVVIEQEDKIICYVHPPIRNPQPFICEGIKETEERIANFFHMNKPIYYVFQNIKFSYVPTFIGQENANILIKNCEFPIGINLMGFNKCFLKDSTIHPSAYFQINTEYLSFKNVTIESFFPEFKVQINTKEMYINSSKIGKETDFLNVSLKSEKAHVMDSQIYGKQIKMEIPKLTIQNSDLHEQEWINIATQKLAYSRKKNNF